MRMTQRPAALLPNTTRRRLVVQMPCCRAALSSSPDCTGCLQRRARQPLRCLWLPRSLLQARRPPQTATRSPPLSQDIFAHECTRVALLRAIPSAFPAGSMHPTISTRYSVPHRCDHPAFVILPPTCCKMSARALSVHESRPLDCGTSMAPASTQLPVHPPKTLSTLCARTFYSVNICR